jgi:hypothetical protein
MYFPQLKKTPNKHFKHYSTLYRTLYCTVADLDDFYPDLTFQNAPNQIHDVTKCFVKFQKEKFNSVIQKTKSKTTWISTVITKFSCTIKN